MRISKKFLCLILAIAILISNITILGNVFAQTADTEPLKIEVTTDKSSYSLLNTAKITVKVTNVSSEAIENVSAEAVFNELIPVGKDSQITAETKKLEAGQSIEFSYNAMLSPNASGVNIFQKILLTIKRFFAGSISVSDNGFNNGRVCIEKDTELYIGNRNIYNFVRVWFESNNNYDSTWSYTVDSSHVIVDEKGNGYVDNMIIVFAGFRTNNEEKDFEQLLKQINGKIVGKTFVGGIYQIQVPTTTKSQLLEWCKYLQTSELVFSAHLNETVRYEIDEATGISNLSQTVPNDPWKDTFQGILGTDWDENNPNGLNWWLEAIEAPSAWNYDDQFNKIKIGIVDDGFDTAHKDLDITLLNQKDNSIESHGTHVAGVIGATANNGIGITGIVWNKELICVDVEANEKQIENNISVWNDIIGIINAIEDGAKVVNISRTLKGKNLHGETFDEIYSSGWKAVNCIVWCKEQLQKDDFIIVQSAGNDNVNTIRAGLFCSITTDVIDKFLIEYNKSGYTYDDIMNHILIVGAIEKKSRGYSMTDFSNYGSQVTISAPGKEIFSTVVSGGLDGDYEYEGWDGTSMAAPMVTGVASLVWSVNPDFTASEVKEIVCNYTNKTATGYGDDTNTYKIVNAKLAVEEAIRRTNPTLNTASVVGTVKDSSTDEIIDKLVTIKIINNNNIIANHTKADRNGMFSVDIPIGEYTILIECEGYETKAINNFAVTDNTSYDLGTIYLSKRNDDSITDEEYGALTDSGTCGENAKWNYYAETATLVIYGSGDMYDYDLSNRPWKQYAEENIKRVIIEKGITKIGNYAFNYCANLTDVTIPNSVTIIGDSAFYCCKYLKNITIPNSVISINTYAFGWCSSLAQIDIPQNVTNIGYGAFYSCVSLANIVIPDSVTNIGSNAFNCCFELETIEVSKNNNYYCSDELGILYNKDKTKILQYPSGNQRKTLIIPSSVISIEAESFYGSLNLTNITIPNSVTNVGEIAFAHCESLKSIILPESIKKISSSSFLMCIGLEFISVVENNNYFSSDENGLLYNKDKTELIICPSNIQKEDLYIPNSVQIIQDYSFYSCYNLIRINIPNSVISIGNYTFSDCYNLENIVIPDSVTSMGYGAFSGCKKLTNVKISNGITKIDGITFSGCSSLSNVVVPNNVTSIGNTAFLGCTNLNSITIPVSVVDIHETAFAYCNNLKNVYYSGTQEQWNNINKGSNNYLNNATIHYNS